MRKAQRGLSVQGPSRGLVCFVANISASKNPFFEINNTENSFQYLELLINHKRKNKCNSEKHKFLVWCPDILLKKITAPTNEKIHNRGKQLIFYLHVLAILSLKIPWSIHFLCGGRKCNTSCIHTNILSPCGRKAFFWNASPLVDCILFHIFGFCSFRGSNLFWAVIYTKRKEARFFTFYWNSIPHNNLVQKPQYLPI